MAVTPLPVLDRTSSTFKTDADNFFGVQLPLFSSQVESARVEVNSNTMSAAASALAAAGSATAAGATIWTNIAYAVGDVRFSPINGQTYRSITAHTTNTDPSLDAVGWARVNLTPQNGGGTVVSSGSSIVLTADSARVQAVTLTAPSLSVSLPAANTLASGGPLHVIKNSGNYSFTVRDGAANVLSYLVPGQCAAFYLTDNTTVAGAWAVGSHSVVATLYPGVTTTLNAVATITSTTVTQLTNTEAIVLYQTGSGGLKARYLVTYAAVIALGAEFTVDATTATFCYGVCRVSATGAIAVYVVGGVLKARTLNVASTTITGGTVLSPSTSTGITGANIVMMGTTSALLTYYATTPAQVFCMTLEANPDTITLTNGAESTGVTAYNFFPQISKLSATLGIISYAHTAGAFSVRTVSISGTVATLNAQLTFSVGLGVYAPIVGISATEAVVACYSSSSSNFNLAYLTVSGTTINMHTWSYIAGSYANYSNFSLAKLSTTQLVLLLTPNAAPLYNKALLLTRVVGDIKQTGAIDMQGTATPTATNSPQIVAFDNNKLVSVYGGIAGYPVATVIEVAS